MKKFLFLIGSVLFPVCLPVQAAQITNLFDDLIATPVDGLSHRGILYSFQVGGASSLDALYGVAFPADGLIGGTVLFGPAGNLTIPALSGLLSLNFAVPTNTLSFAIAFNSEFNESFTLQLFDLDNNPDTPITIATTIDPGCNPAVSQCFSETRYQYGGSAPIGQARLDFSAPQAESFALSTLVYDVAIPEPETVWLSAGGMLAAAAWGRRYFKKQPDR